MIGMMLYEWKCISRKSEATFEFCYLCNNYQFQRWTWQQNNKSPYQTCSSLLRTSWADKKMQMSTTNSHYILHQWLNKNDHTATFPEETVAIFSPSLVEDPTVHQNAFGQYPRCALENARHGDLDPQPSAVQTLLVDLEIQNLEEGVVLENLHSTLLYKDLLQIHLLDNLLHPKNDHDFLVEFFRSQ